MTLSTTTALQASCESCKQSADSRSCDSHVTLSITTTTTAIQASCESCDIVKVYDSAQSLPTYLALSNLAALFAARLRQGTTFDPTQR